MMTPYFGGRSILQGEAMPSDFEAFVAGRLDELENCNRRLRRNGTWLAIFAVGQGIILLYLLLPVSGWLGVPKYVEATRFVLVDDRGRVRGELTMDQGPVLQLRTDDGKERAVLTVNHENAAHLLLLDNRDNGGRAAHLYAYDNGAALELRDRNGGKISLALSDMQSGLQMFDEKGLPVPGVPKP